MVGGLLVNIERFAHCFYSINRHLQTHKAVCHHSCKRTLCHLGSVPGSSDVETCSVPQSSCLQHWFKNWTESRKNKLTASTFAGAIGFWRGRRVKLWQEKIGAVEPFSGNLATIWGNIKEQEALERYKLITGNVVLFPEFQVYGNKSPDDNWLGCSPDGVVDNIVYGLSYHGVLEIKCPFFNGDKQRSYPWSRVPLYFIPQAQGLMEILDKDWMDFYCWTVNGSSLFRLYRDQAYWELMEEALSDFWFKHVLPARELYRKSPITNPLIQLRSLKPAPRHELCPAIVDASKYLVDDSVLLMREIHGKLQMRASRDFHQLEYDEMQSDNMRKHWLQKDQVVAV